MSFPLRQSGTAADDLDAVAEDAEHDLRHAIARALRERDALGDKRARHERHRCLAAVEQAVNTIRSVR